MSSFRELFSIGEIEGLLQGLDVVTFVAEDEDSGGVSLSIECRQGEIEWSVLFSGEGPFFSRAMLMAIARLDKEIDPFRFVNQWNEDHLESTVVVSTDDSMDPLVGDDGNWVIVLRSFLVFLGSVSFDHLEFKFESWIDDVRELISDEEDVVAEEGSTQKTPHDVTDLDLVHQLLQEKGPMSSKDIAKILVLPKHDVNHLIYMHLEDFEKHPGQPPKWSSRG